MTVSSSTRKSGPYIGNGATTTFARTFLIFDDAHLRVEVDGVEVTSGFTHTGIGSASGSVVFASAPVSGARIMLIRDVPNVQESDYSNEGVVSPEQIERDLDLLAMQSQDIAEAVSRVPQLPPESDGGFTLAEPEAGRVLVGTATGWGNGPNTDEISSAQGYATAAGESATVASEAASTATTAAETATNAATAAGESATTATNAATAAGESATTATNAATAAGESATTATNAAGTATTAADNAATSETNATTAAGTASDAATAAVDAAGNAEAAWGSFDGRYLGEKTSDPSTDNNGDPLVTGAVYFNSSTNTMRTYNGLIWTTLAGGAGLFKGNNGETGDTAAGHNDIFRVNAQTLTADVTIEADENASAAGPITVADGVTLTVLGNLVVI